jgi:hypothetical protein
MSRYIDADAIISFVDAGHLRNPLELAWSDNDVVDMIESRPTVDAVPVEWIKNHIREQVECDNRTYAMTIRAMLDWYELNCADGERRSDEQ